MLQWVVQELFLNQRMEPRGPKLPLMMLLMTTTLVLIGHSMMSPTGTAHSLQLVHQEKSIPQTMEQIAQQEILKHLIIKKNRFFLNATNIVRQNLE